ncbi:MAG TPA: xanthine dehydrogenase family protein subunit M [Solirubrobacterales bacterium]|nr:xanthine dehydrogenase family protein subunit M [Solirubrobacterales bacterium]
MQVPAPFEYERATSVEGALQLLAQLGSDARILAGGYSLLPMMKLRLATPKWVVDIDPLATELGYVEEDDDLIRIGAMTRHRDLLDSGLLAERAPIFRDAEREIADPVVRNRGTIGGALCQADPSEDLSAVCTAVGAEIVIRSLAEERVLHMEDFYVGPYRTAVADDEMVVEIRVPLHDRTSSAYEKVNRRVGDWAVAAAGAALTVEDGVIADAGVALVAVGSEVSSTAAREALIGRPPSAETFEAAAAAGAAACTPITDQRGTAEYKRHAAGVLAARALGRAAERVATGVA